MKKTIGILGLIILGLSYILFVTYSKSKRLSDELEISKKKTKVVYVKKYIDVPKPYEVYLKPDKEIRYLPDTTKNKYDSVGLSNLDILLFNHKQLLSVSDTLRISKLFLRQFPNNSKLISFDLSSDELSLQLLRISGMPVKEVYSVDFNKYKYRYSEERLTTKRVKNLHIIPELSYSYRLLHNLHDVDFNLNFKTTNFNYKLGGNTFYYPAWDKVGYDLKLTLQYNF